MWIICNILYNNLLMFLLIENALKLSLVNILPLGILVM